MHISEEHRLAAKLEREREQQAQPKMTEEAAPALARGSCKSCALPCDTVAMGGHVPISGSAWLCGCCFRLLMTTPLENIKRYKREHALAVTCRELYARKKETVDLPLGSGDPKGVRECALRSRCVRAVNRHGHPVTGKSQYCSAACRARSKFPAQSKTPNIGSETRINIERNEGV